MVEVLDVRDDEDLHDYTEDVISSDDLRLSSILSEIGEKHAQTRRMTAQIDHETLKCGRHSRGVSPKCRTQKFRCHIRTASELATNKSVLKESGTSEIPNGREDGAPALTVRSSRRER